jgi:U3 small nucleolar RNA-associated protein 6
VDYARYAEYEMNLDLLRRKRVKRLGIKSTTYIGQRRIFFILDRATRKFHGDIGLWVQYLEYARKQKAHKKLSQIFSDVLRLHPANVELWIYAAKYAVDDHADMTLARSYMQRGLRFCKSAKNLWIQYARLEIIYITKIAARRRILGLDMSHEGPVPDNPIDEPNADVIVLPQITAEDINPSLDEDEADQDKLQNLHAVPALSGAIPMAIFDAAMKQFNDDAGLGREFFDMVLQFEDVPCLSKVIDHIVARLLATSPGSYHAQICSIKAPTAGIKLTSPSFPRAFTAALNRLKQYPLEGDLAQAVAEWMQPVVEVKELDPALHKVVVAMLQRSRHALQKPSSEV